MNRKVTIFINGSDDASFGLNVGFDARGKFTEARSHPLIEAFTYESRYEDDASILRDAWHEFNVGATRLAAKYRAKGLPSLSTGDVIQVDGTFWALPPGDWFTQVPAGDLWLNGTWEGGGREGTKFAARS